MTATAGLSPKAIRSRDLAAMAEFRREWLAGVWRKAKLPDLIEKMAWFEDAVFKYPHRQDTDIPITEEMTAIIEQAHLRLVKSSESEDPIAFFRPSWMQAQVLNAWHPAFEPDVAPKGYRTVMDVSAVRSGKTCKDVINQIMWLIPNNAEWLMFEPYTDFKGRHVQVLRRPLWDYWNRTGKMIYSDAEPPKDTCECWHGCPDEMHWKEKLNREYMKWMPGKHIGRRGNEPLWNLSERWFETKWGSRVNGKLYMSDMQAWSGKELFLITFDEGPPKDKLEEARIRASYINWSYTPREAANTGDRTRIAYEVWSGKFDLPGPIRRFQFGWDDVPDHVMSRDKKDMRLAMLKEGSAADRVTREGGFFFSSPVVFDAFRRNKHILPITGEQVRRWIVSEATAQERQEYPWWTKFIGANIIRGFDEGTAHPTSCVWRALLRTGESVYFREYLEAAHSITKRAEDIIALSGNERLLVENPEDAMSAQQMDVARMFAPDLLKDRQRETMTGAKIPRYREKFKGMRIRKTVADSKIFRRDPNHPLDDWTQNYSRAGLRMERATNAVPAARCDYMNGTFYPDHTRKHLNPAQDDADKPHGFLSYVTKDCEKLVERLENYLQGQITAGPRVGEFTGKPEVRDDDLIDGFCYAGCERLRWVDMATLQRTGDL